MEKSENKKVVLNSAGVFYFSAFLSGVEHFSKQFGYRIVLSEGKVLVKDVNMDTVLYFDTNFIRLDSVDINMYISNDKHIAAFCLYVYFLRYMRGYVLKDAYDGFFDYYEPIRDFSKYIENR